MTAPSRASIFRRGSRTYYYSSLFFPPDVRSDVFTLYAFVRVADDFVDNLPQDGAGFEAFAERYRMAQAGRPAGDTVVDGFVALARRRGFDPDWVTAFLESMRRDLTIANYLTIADLEAYMYGSAEVVGLMMARILGLPEAALPYARRLGQAMQYVNFLRDVRHDQALGRTYLPVEILLGYDLADLRRDTILARRDGFRALMRAEVERYRHWQVEAEAGYPFIPVRYRIPVQTAADMYRWTADRIADDPLVVLYRRLKPSVARIIWRGTANGLAGLWPALASLAALRRCRP